MFRNYLATALRNLSRNRLYAGVTIAGLVIGFASALLIGLYVRGELSFDRFVPGGDRVFVVGDTIYLPGAKPIDVLATPAMLAPQLKLAFPEIETTARVSTGFPVAVQHGAAKAMEHEITWVDPDFFRVFPLPAAAGDPASALAAADAVVVTRSVARKYFKRDTPLGEMLQIGRQPYRVAAVIEDLPTNSHLTSQIYISGRAAASPLSPEAVGLAGPVSDTVATYFRLRPGASVDTMRPRLASFAETHMPFPPSAAGRSHRVLHLVPLRRIHLTPATLQGASPSTDPTVVAAIALVGVLIVVVAAINFVTLMTARAARRAVEVGVRKAAGARRRDLIIQFLGEAFLQVLIAAVMGVALAEMLLPHVNALLWRPLVLDYLHDPALVAAMLGVVLLTALLAGAYPAFVLSSFRPSAVLKGGLVQIGGGGVRQVLVIGQFAVLIGLVLTAATIARQTAYALNAASRVDKDQVFLVFSQPCHEELRDEIARVPGVRTAACASAESIGLGLWHNDVLAQGRSFNLQQTAVDFGFFEVFGIRPLAGRLFDRSRAADGVSEGADPGGPVILNATAVRRLGYAAPREALGKTIRWRGPDAVPGATSPPPIRRAEIIGVVPDFTLGSVREPIEPAIFAIGSNRGVTSVGMVFKLDRSATPETLATIDALGRRFSDGGPLMRLPVGQFTMRLYMDTLIQGGLIGVAGLIALVIAALGLFALSAYTTERRTQEIGVRKAMGASSADILRLLIWQFTQPILWAILIAWPVTWLVLRWWLAGFAYHVDVAPWTFLAVGAGALLIAWATVFVHALNVARAKPVSALRYE